MLEWKQEYEIGVELIDKQHQHLLEIGNSIYDLLENYLLADKYDKIVEIINELREYTKYHFKTEEGYMLKIKYPKYFDQKNEHDDFIAKIDEINLNDVDENQDKYIRDLLMFVFNWTIEHILKKDKLIMSSN
ncbi:hemerythrin-like metal-binding domain-containing protein [Desulfosporosinus orientis DSM 765]|uniref:Hemerythrin-like metal-binding domain-containing protein n=1 Tax=Desulfosporosinus orientis (strain ATCC 19365 / DSM 765 / NCIMB 8382 / VKM B-1628 / Singapore I) TaxID=768706 RepID=G7WJ25_DESOD|nr:hemerythrin family protein [Desulfosporosinus orientis]AET70337.1 hemerythrin-like metal-binding domain-containing protein [Desulfosporosinus orientis DSM 765]